METDITTSKIRVAFTNAGDITACLCSETKVCLIHNIYDENRTNHDVIADWVQRLRSGDYLQGKNNLRTDDDCYCCLGVLADIVAPKGWLEDTTEETYLLNVISDGNGIFLLQDIIDALGIDDWTQRILAGLNDISVSFDEIADCIEANSFASIVKNIPELAQREGF